MFKKFIIVSSITSLLVTGALPAFAETTTPSTTTPPILGREGVAMCMQAATKKKNAAFRTAHAMYKKASKNAENREMRKKVRQDYSDALAAAKKVFKADSQVCHDMLKKMKEVKKEERKDKDEKEMTVKLLPQNNSGISGRAKLEQENGKVEVELKLEGATGTTFRPAHIHSGSCATLGAVKYPLTSVENNKSTTVLNVTFAQLKSELPLAINVHKSADEANVYVACGDLK